MRIFTFHLKKRALAVVGCAALLAVGIGAGAGIGRVRMAAGKPKSVFLPAVMYHHILEDGHLLGDYVITPGQLESDMQYLREQGYTAVLPREAAAWVRGEGDLPEKPVLITFDDGNRSAAVYAAPILERHGMRGTLAVIGIHSEKYSLSGDDNVAYAHASWDELKALEECGIFEIANHTYNMHEEQTPRRGTLRNPGEPLEDYRAALRDDLSTCQQLLEAATGRIPTTFVYPYGFIDEAADDVIRDLEFSATLGVEEKVSTLVRGDPETLRGIGRFNRPYSASTASFFERIFSQIPEKE